MQRSTRRVNKPHWFSIAGSLLYLDAGARRHSKCNRTKLNARLALRQMADLFNAALCRSASLAFSFVLLHSLYNPLLQYLGSFSDSFFVARRIVKSFSSLTRFMVFQTKILGMTNILLLDRMYLTGSLYFGPNKISCTYFLYTGHPVSGRRRKN